MRHLLTKLLCILLIISFGYYVNSENKLPIVINTWAFLNSTEEAWKVLINGGNAIDAVEIGCATCEKLQCDGTVGFGGSPDENGETTLDAMIMNGEDLNIGAVAGLRRIKNAISVAKHVLSNTKHSLLVGDLATKFAVQMGFTEETLQTTKSYSIWEDWRKKKCQPNFWTNVSPNPSKTCGPYQPDTKTFTENDITYDCYNSLNHDTIGIIVIDEKGNIVAGTSTNGARHKIPGRVGDSPIPGAGAYADNDVGAAAATGDGDIMMRLLPSYLTVEEMRRGKTPAVAAQLAISRITHKYSTFFGGIIAVNKLGDFGAACHGMDYFPFGVRTLKSGKVLLMKVKC